MAHMYKMLAAPFCHHCWVCSGAIICRIFLNKTTMGSRTLDCRIKEHKRATEKKDVANRIAVHQMETKHRIEWEGATCMEFNGFADERMFLESWFTKCDENSINICRDMPGAYTGLIANERRLACFKNTREQTNSRTRARHFDAR